MMMNIVTENVSHVGLSKMTSHVLDMPYFGSIRAVDD
jgi:hypothetical protein